MPKIQVKVTLTTPDINDEKIYNAIFHPDENSIVYKEENNTTTKFDLNKMKLRRENKELYMEYQFNEKASTTGKIEVKSINQKLELKLKTKAIIKKQDKIEIEYQVEEDRYKYKLEVI